MKKIMIFMLLAILPSVSYAQLDRSTLYESHYYSGANDRTIDLGDDGTLNIHLEFAVYRDETQYGGTVNEAQYMMDYTGYTGDAEYVYAYQVFCEESSEAVLTYFALTGINPGAIQDVQSDIGQAEYLDDGIPTESGGKGPSDSYFNDSVTEAIWEFDGGAIAQGEKSWFLFLYSDYDKTAGDIIVRAAANDDIPVPDEGGDNPVPEPATVAILIGGFALSLTVKPRKQSI